VRAREGDGADQVEVAGGQTTYGQVATWGDVDLGDDPAVTLLHLADLDPPVAVVVFGCQLVSRLLHGRRVIGRSPPHGATGTAAADRMGSC
jgi:hypothetical protein